MKLNLTAKRVFQILTASGVISLQDARVLQAGAVKILKESRYPLILDLTQAKVDDTVRPALLELRLAALGLPADLWVVSPDDGFGQMKSLDEAKELLVSGRPVIQHRVNGLHQLVTHLEGQKSQLDAEAATLEENIVKQQRLPEKNKHLQEVVAVMEKRVRELAKRLADFEPITDDAETAVLEEQLLNVLMGERFQVAQSLKARAPA